MMLLKPSVSQFLIQIICLLLGVGYWRVPTLTVLKSIWGFICNSMLFTKLWACARCIYVYNYIFLVEFFFLVSFFPYLFWLLSVWVLFYHMYLSCGFYSCNGTTWWKCTLVRKGLTWLIYLSKKKIGPETQTEHKSEGRN